MFDKDGRKMRKFQKASHCSLYRLFVFPPWLNVQNKNVRSPRFFFFFMQIIYAGEVITECEKWSYGDIRLGEMFLRMLAQCLIREQLSFVLFKLLLDSASSAHLRLVAMTACCPYSNKWRHLDAAIVMGDNQAHDDAAEFSPKIAVWKQIVVKSKAVC